MIECVTIGPELTALANTQSIVGQAAVCTAIMWYGLLQRKMVLHLSNVFLLKDLYASQIVCNNNSRYW